MEKVTRMLARSTFNGPLEAGVRAVAVLGAAFPTSYDIQRLTAYDYLLVRTHKLGGPNDLHPQALIEAPATEVRRKVVQKGLLLMTTRDLITRTINSDGIRYMAGESAAPFLGCLTSPYFKDLRECADWIFRKFKNLSDQEFREIMQKYFDDWIIEFQSVERSLGSGQ